MAIRTETASPSKEVLALRADRGRLNYVKQRLKDIKAERDRLMEERKELRAKLGFGAEKNV